MSFGKHLLKTRYPMKLSNNYFANGTYADLWIGDICGETVAVKVWRGVSLSDKNRRSLEIVSFSFLLIIRY
jgi:hypothetical protein